MSSEKASRIPSPRSPAPTRSQGGVVCREPAASCAPMSRLRHHRREPEAPPRQFQIPAQPVGRGASRRILEAFVLDDIDHVGFRGCQEGARRTPQIALRVRAVWSAKSGIIRPERCLDVRPRLRRTPADRRQTTPRLPGQWRGLAFGMPPVARCGAALPPGTQSPSAPATPASPAPAVGTRAAPAPQASQTASASAARGGRHAHEKPALSRAAAGCR